MQTPKIFDRGVANNTVQNAKRDRSKGREIESATTKHNTFRQRYDRLFKPFTKRKYTIKQIESILIGLYEQEVPDKQIGSRLQSRCFNRHTEYDRRALGRLLGAYVRREISRLVHPHIKVKVDTYCTTKLVSFTCTTAGGKMVLDRMKFYAVDVWTLEEDFFNSIDARIRVWVKPLNKRYEQMIMDAERQILIREYPESEGYS